jgi:hypothetical protein
MEKPDYRHRRPLRVCGERPSNRRAADKSDEIAAPHVSGPLINPTYHNRSRDVWALT